MKPSTFLIALLMLLSFACENVNPDKDLLPSVPEGAQALSLSGVPLMPAQPSETLLEKYNTAKLEFEADENNPDKLIWFGRRTAYKGDYREAIRIFTEGIKLFPDDARMYRHRGHRYISIRAFERAITDFEEAVDLIEGKTDMIEPDGMPNTMNIPVSTLHTNIWYHLGLAAYLNQDLEKARWAWLKGIEASDNDDMLVATTHWLYMTLRLMGNDEEARAVLMPIDTAMHVIENAAYYDLCLMYKGIKKIGDFTGEGFSDIMNDAMTYGIGNWYFYNGEPEKATVIFEKILEGSSWASFGYIAAEADMQHHFKGT